MNKVTGIVLLEGPDGTGKTTLAKALCEKYNGHYIHLTYVKDIYPYQTAALVEAVSKCSQQLVVIDRHWISEQIYARVYRNGSEMAHSARGMDRVLRKHCCLYIMCVPDTAAEVKEQFDKLRQERQEMYTEGMEHVAQRYINLMDGTPFTGPVTDYVESLTGSGVFKDGRPDVIRYRVFKDKMSTMVDAVPGIINGLKRLQFSPALDPNNVNILGWLGSAKYLIVGDVPATFRKGVDQHSWPFYVNRFSAKFLYEAFYAADLDERDYMWCNANGQQPEHTILLMQDRTLTPIALGKEAERIVKLYRQDYVRVHHPSRVRRFKTHTPLEYGRLLAPKGN